MSQKIIVAHPHKQHSFQFATALEMNGSLSKYVTTVYDKPGSLTSRFTKYLPDKDREKARARKSSYLPNDKVEQVCELGGLLYLLAMRLTNNRKSIMEPLDSRINKSFGKKLAMLSVASSADAVVCYDTQSDVLFSELKRLDESIIRVLDVSAANLLFLKGVYEKDIALSPQFSYLLKEERPQLLSPYNSSSYFSSLRREIENSDYFIAPSKFVQDSLLYSGVKENQIFVQPYGIDTTLFECKKEYRTNRPLKFVYVGGIKQLKGIGYLLEAFSDISPTEATLTIVGSGDIYGTPLERYAPNAVFTGPVLHNKIPAILREHDVFLFPSLGDSFGFAPLEAAASGLPIVVSENTGLSDHVRDGIEGFVIKPHSASDIRERVEWFIENADEHIESMGLRARKMACSLTLEKYYHGIQETMAKICS